MDDDEPIEPRQLRRNSDPAPSHLAAEHVVVQGVAEDEKSWTLRLVRQFPGITVREMNEWHLSESDSRRYGRRLSLLLDDGAVLRVMRVCAVTGRQAFAWWPGSGEPTMFVSDDALAMRTEAFDL